MLSFEQLSDGLTARMEYEKDTGTYPRMGFDHHKAVRRVDYPTDRGTVWRPDFSRDVDKILHCPYYNRYSDKTQVFSLLKNDDVSRRGLHVQIVSRIARTIGAALNLNLDLIEAIALGHDIGHPPFGHTGERYLDALYHARTGRHFCHNLQSVRVLDQIFPLNLPCRPWTASPATMVKWKSRSIVRSLWKALNSLTPPWSAATRTRYTASS